MTNTEKPMYAEGTSNLVQPKFGPGMLLQHEDLELQTTYTQQLNRLMLKSLFGCGVVCGLDVSFDPKSRTITVKRGVAIDGYGDLIEVPRDHNILASENCQEPGEDLWVVLCRTVKYCVQRSTTCSDDDSTTQPTRAIYGYEIHIKPEFPSCACGCVKVTSGDGGTPEYSTDECYDSHQQLKCNCTCNGETQSNSECVLLARVKKDESEPEDTSVRRVVRPELLPNPASAPGQPSDPDEGDQNAELQAREKALFRLLKASKGMITTKDNKEDWNELVEEAMASETFEDGEFEKIDLQN